MGIECLYWPLGTRADSPTFMANSDLTGTQWNVVVFKCSFFLSPCLNIYSYGNSNINRFLYKDIFCINWPSSRYCFWLDFVKTFPLFEKTAFSSAMTVIDLSRVSFLTLYLCSCGMLTSWLCQYFLFALHLHSILVFVSWW